MDAKAGARERFDMIRDSMIALSHRIHAHPELGYEEEKAASWLSETLADAGFAVEKGICDLPTAFIARAGNGPLHLAICAEYDCLPGIGHACGQILLLERGAFTGMHAAMMVHPAPFDVVEMPIIAASMFEVRYTGKEAHASAFPELGINAADALTIAQTAIGLLRQHIRQSDRIHGIVTDGGDAPNVVPAHTAAKYMVRAKTLGDLDEIRAKVRRCFEAGALATGAKLEIQGGDRPYAEMHHDPDIAAAYRRNAEALGRVSRVATVSSDRAAGSTDMGNVSLKIPSIHPAIGIDSLPAVNHQPEFAAHCISAPADKAVVDAALAMAFTAIDIAEDSALRNRLISKTAA